jgi:hypothetical protein
VTAHSPTDFATCVLSGAMRVTYRSLGGVDAAVEQDDRDLGLLGLLQLVLPARRLGGRQEDDVDLVVDEGRERVELRLLVARAGRRSVLEVEAGILGERVLDGLLVGVAPAALGTDGDEADRDGHVATGRSVTVPAGSAPPEHALSPTTMAPVAATVSSPRNPRLLMSILSPP